MRDIKVRANDPKQKKQAMILEQFLNNDTRVVEELRNLSKIIYSINNHNMMYGTNLELNESVQTYTSKLLPITPKGSE